MSESRQTPPLIPHPHPHPESSLLSLLLTLLTIAIFTAGNGVSGLQFDMSTLTLTTLKFLGDAHLTNSTMRLTKDLAVPNSGAGRVLYSKPIPFRKPESPFPASFSSFFSFSVTNLNPSSIGGGLAFVITPDDESVGGAGGLLGLVAGGGASEFVAVEFDTLMDVEFKDVNGNHVGIDVNSMVSKQTADLGVSGIDLKSGNLINAWVEFDGVSQMLNVSVSYSNLKPKFPILFHELDLSRHLSDFVFVGFSGSTQGSTEMHSIEWWSFTSSFESNHDGSVSAPSPPAAELVVPSAYFFNSTATPPSPPPADSHASTKESKPSSSSCGNQLCKQGAGAVAGVATAGAFCLALLAAVLIWAYTKKVKRVKKMDTLGSDVIKMPKVFTYKDLKAATKCFDSSRIIGHGAFGVVYRGVMTESGDIVAVKRCSHNSQGKNEFLSELSIIGSLRHRNLVRLQGWCHEKGEILLVYDLMPNGSLDKALFEARTPLPWYHRQRILMGVASALAYLHQECENQVIHRDVKTSNIMLDEGFRARLGDFGLARQVEHDKSPEATVAAGTMGYLAPEYLLTGRASEKTDVFSYGAVVLEVASGRRPIEKETSGARKVGAGGNLVEWVWSLHRDGKLLTAADDKLRGEFDEAEMRKVLLVGLICSHPDPSARPTMRAVVQMLAGEAEVPIVPRTRPSLTFSTSHLLLSLQDSVSDYNGIISLSSYSSENSYIGGDELV
ncbi:unnamed protein product [Rhodiola kirilowii]